VDEIATHQRIIDGARQVVEGWSPDIELELADSLPEVMDEWEKVKFGDICENLDSQRKPVTKSDRVQGQYPYYGASGIVDYVEEYIFDGKYLLVSEDGANLLARSTPIAFSVEGKVWVNNHAHILKFEEQVTQTFVEIYLNSIDLSIYITGAAQPKLNQAALNSIPIPLPPLEIQREIVARIETERAIVHGNRELIRLYEEKVKKVIEKVWLS
jgi:restriction endonuclease S subunit